MQNCLEALDETYIMMNVMATDRSRYRTQKDKVVTNVLRVYDMKEDFVFILASLEGSAVDLCILRDAISRPNGLKVLKGNCY